MFERVCKMGRDCGQYQCIMLVVTSRDKTFSATDVLVITEIAYLPNTSTCVTCKPACSVI